MELGVAESIRVKQFSHDISIDQEINKWLAQNPNIDVIDIKYAASMDREGFMSEALLIYRR